MERGTSVDYGSEGSGVTGSPGLALQSVGDVNPRVRQPSRTTVRGTFDLCFRRAQSWISRVLPGLIEKLRSQRWRAIGPSPDKPRATRRQ